MPPVSLPLNGGTISNHSPESALAGPKRQLTDGHFIVAQTGAKSAVLEIDAVLRSLDRERIAVDAPRELDALQRSVSGNVELEPAVDHGVGARECLQRTQRRAVEVRLERVAIPAGSVAHHRC